MSYEPDKKIVMDCCEPMRQAQRMCGCTPMITPKGGVDGCDDNWNTSWDDDTPGLPPLKFCPWCGAVCAWEVGT